MICRPRYATDPSRPFARAIVTATLSVGLLLGALSGVAHAQSIRYMSTLAGNGDYGTAGDGGFAPEAQMAYPQGVAVDSRRQRLHRRYPYGRIRKVAAGTVVITDRGRQRALGYSGDGGPATEAQLLNPTAVAVDADGHLYIADTENHRIRRVEARPG